MADARRTVVLDGDQLIRLCRARGWSQEKLADEAGISSVNTIKRAESGQPVLAKTARAIAKALGVSVETLLVSESAADTPPQELGPRPSPSTLISISRLLELTATRFPRPLLGRAKERELLTAAWTDRSTRILVIVAEAGVGKTSLVAEWLREFMRNGWGGVDAFFDWSFYSQGTRDQNTANSRAFFDAALSHFGQAAHTDQWAGVDIKADILAHSISDKRTLMVLDGIEPLQHPKRSGQEDGRLRDEGLRRFLMRLAQSGPTPAFCVVTTRLRIADLVGFEGATVRVQRLENLSPTAAGELLYLAGAQKHGAKGLTRDAAILVEVARALRGHALTVQLLGAYLKHAHRGDIQRRDRVEWPMEGHASSVMQSYEHWFEAAGDRSRQQLAMLRILGLFDRPATERTLRALCAGAPIEGLTEPLVGRTDYEWGRLLNELEEEHRLIALMPANGHERAVDTHALIRAHFSQQLQAQRPAAWRAGHHRLYRILCASAQPQPETLEDLQPLYQAVAHGCLAGLQEHVWSDVLLPRIWRGDGNNGFFSLRKLGAVEADLGAMACLFERPWEKPSPNLTAQDQAALLAYAGVYLHSMGRLADALLPMSMAVEMATAQGDPFRASYYTGRLSELELTLGEAPLALAHAEKALVLSDESGVLVECIKQRCKRAHALHETGSPQEALELFQEAELLQKQHEPTRQLLYSMPLS